MAIATVNPCPSLEYGFQKKGFGVSVNFNAIEVAEATSDVVFRVVYTTLLFVQYLVDNRVEATKESVTSIKKEAKFMGQCFLYTACERAKAGIVIFHSVRSEAKKAFDEHQYLGKLFYPAVGFIQLVILGDAYLNPVTTHATTDEA